MYITLDGLSGSGKSTQLRILSQQLDVKPVPFSSMTYPLSTIGHLIGINSTYTKLSNAILASHSIPTDQNSIIDHFWNCMSSINHTDTSVLIEAINFFRKGLTLGDCAEPILSVYIDVPHEIRTQRRFARDIHTPFELVITPEKKKHRMRTLHLWQTLQEHVPYLHIVDGTLPADVVSQSIIKLLN